MARLLTESEIQEIWLAHFDSAELPDISRFAKTVEDAVCILLGCENELTLKEVIELKRKAGWTDERDKEIIEMYNSRLSQ